MSKHMKDKISLYMDGMLVAGEAAAFEAHIKSCADCSAAFEAQKKAVKAAKTVKDEPLPVNFMAKLNEKLDAVDEKRKNPVSRLNYFIRASAAAFAVVLVGFFVYSLREQTGGFKGAAMKADSQMPAEQEYIPQAAPVEKARQKARAAAPEVKKAEAETEKPAAAAVQVKALNLNDTDKKQVSKDALYDIAVKPVQAPKARSAAGLAMKTEETAAPVMEMSEESSGGAVSQRQYGDVKAVSDTAFMPVFKVFRDEKSWNEFAEGKGIKTDKKPDFSSEMILFVSAGEKPSAGYAVEITGVDYGTDKVTVYYRETNPAPGSMNAQVITYPYAVKAVKKSGLPVEFKELR